MRDKREHLFGGCLEAGGDNKSFLICLQAEKDKFEKKAQSVKIPPPERDVYLNIELVSTDHLVAISLERYFGFIVDAMSIIQGIESMEKQILLDGIISRSARDNRLIGYYGIKLILLAEGLKDDILYKLYHAVEQKCEYLSNKLGIPLYFDIARNAHHLDSMLENEHCRMACNDIKAQFAAARM